jgi:hypothetical protein
MRLDKKKKKKEEGRNSSEISPREARVKEKDGKSS